MTDIISENLSAFGQDHAGAFTGPDDTGHTPDPSDEVPGYIEKMFEKYGAVPADSAINDSLKKQGLRSCYIRDGVYYRAEYCMFEDHPVIVITATDKAEFAKVGIQDNVGGFSAELPKEKLEKEVRFLFGIEPYPETYPDY